MKIIRRLKKFLAGLNSSSKQDWLRAQGAAIGAGVVLCSDINSFGSEPYLVSIGNDCTISFDVRFITHDGGVDVLNHLGLITPPVDKLAPVEIGNNVFIGAKSMIMPGVTIGDNSIIGAGSIVTKSIPSGSVAVGVPARVIMTVQEYAEKLKTSPMLHYTWGMSPAEKKTYCAEKLKK